MRKVMLLNFSRPSLGQTGSGHFSPIAAWHAASDMALVLDTARFKYPVFWAPVDKVWSKVVMIWCAVRSDCLALIPCRSVFFYSESARRLY